MALDGFVLSNVAAVQGRGGSMQRQAETLKFRHAGANGRSGEGESDALSVGFSKTGLDVISLSQAAKGVRQGQGLSTFSFVMLTAMGQSGTQDEGADASGSPPVREKGTFRRALQAYGRTGQASKTSVPPPDPTSESPVSEETGNLPASFSVVV